jgi:hypothetical protein
LAARLSYYHAASNGLLSCLPLQLTLRGESTTQSYRTPVYYVDLTLRNGIHLQEAIQTAKEIDQKSKLYGFNQAALDQMARQCLAKAMFEVNAEEGLYFVEEFYVGDGVESGKTQPESNTETKPKFTQGKDFVQDIQKGLQGSVRAVN